MDLNEFLTYSARAANRTFARYANGAPFARVRPKTPPLVAPGFVALRLQTGIHANGKPVLYSDMQAPKLSTELNEALRPLYAAAMHGNAQLPETLCTVDSGPVLRLASPLAPAPVPWRANAHASYSLPVGTVTDWHGVRTVAWDRRIDPHALIAGSTGSGKSVAMRQIILELASVTGPDKCEIVLIDLKNAGLAPLAALPHVRQPLAWKPDSAAALLAAVETELQRRIQSGSNEHPLLVLAVDELTELLEGDKVRQQAFSSIARLGREKRIAIIGGTQKPMLTELGQGVSQMTFQLIGRMRSGRDTKTASGGVAVDGSDLAYPGIFYAVSTGRSPEIVQVPYADDATASAAVAALRTRYPSSPSSLLSPGVAAVSTEDRAAADRWKRAAADAFRLVAQLGESWQGQTERQQMIALGINPQGSSFYSGQKRLELVREVVAGAD